LNNDYVLGYASNEMKRLQIQALLFESSAKNSLIKAGLKPDMKCMDVGCGIGNVSELMSDMVGNKGTVLGTDIEKKYVKYCNNNIKSKNMSLVLVYLIHG
jgi:ubiquinone/menaquinone biosynthesis C-methylase UbiE